MAKPIQRPTAKTAQIEAWAEGSTDFGSSFRVVKLVCFQWLPCLSSLYKHGVSVWHPLAFQDKDHICYDLELDKMRPALDFG